MKYGLLGRKLTHSYSPAIHKHLGEYPYHLYEVEPENLEAFLLNYDFAGLNVTMPYKKAVIDYCAELTPCAQALGSVNTILRLPNGKLLGHNSDYFGFISMLNQCHLSVESKKVLVLGSGGASNTAVSALTELGARVIVISRTGENNYTNLSRHSDVAVIVNTTPVGMYPNTMISPINLSQFPNLECVLDVIYNPARTQLLLDAESRGLKTMNGLWMLVAQAKESAQYFLGKEIPDSTIETIYKNIERQTQNIILIGMPGCGKTTIGKMVAAALSKEFVDLDEEISKLTGCTIPQIFDRFGEEGFRKLETQVAEEVSKRSSLVIATGGGIVTDIRNYPILHQNGRIFWIQRNIELLSREGRPLSQSTDLHQMLTDRMPSYHQFSDLVVANNSTLADAVAKILEGT